MSNGYHEAKPPIHADKDAENQAIIPYCENADEFSPLLIIMGGSKNN